MVYAQMPLINVHVGVFSKVKGLNFSLSLQLFLYIVQAQASLRIYSLAFTKYVCM